MTKRLTFGFMIPQLVPWPTMVERFQLTEAWGLDSAWVVDHFVNPGMPTGRWFEGWTMLAALAAQTQRVRIGAMVTSISFRNPAMLAKEALTVDHISGGRLIVGLGAGGQQRDHTMTGSQPWPTGERFERFGEFVAIVDALLRAEEPVTYEGRYYRVDEAIMTPGPLQEPRPPFLIGSSGPRMLRYVAKYADYWNTSGAGPGLVARNVTPSEVVANVRAGCDRLDQLAAAQGRDPAEITRSLMAGGGANPENPWASVEAFRDFVGRYSEAGVTDFVFYYPSRIEMMSGPVELICREVLPTLPGRGD
jgi:alkanesulfonate monooxygenase SsuD/methylene tetrahydromethanopterin reductase-like flavin-dependent oxidoreductase (luciferase family)